MSYIIDFDDRNSFPIELSKWDACFEENIVKKVDYTEMWWELLNQLRDMHIEETPFVKRFVSENADVEIAVFHCTRQINIDSISQKGLITGGGCIAEKRIRDLFQMFGADDDNINNRIIDKMHFFWDRDKTTRVDEVHFFVERNLVFSKDSNVSLFSENIGGETLRWAIDSVQIDIKKDLKCNEPYNRFWTEGTPYIIKFKCKLNELCKTQRNSIIAEIVMYNVITKIFGFSTADYCFEFYGHTSKSVPPTDIMEIYEIKEKQ